jgi:broad specificity phosphatase PhoE
MNEQAARRLGWRYAAVVAATLIVVGLVYCYFCCGPATTVLLVRHADRQGSDDALSREGIARAQALAQVAGKWGITAIFTSDAARTQQTAEPTAEALGIKPVAVTGVAELVEAIRTSHQGRNVLVVGHSNTVPQIIAALGGPAVTIGESEYDNLFVLTIYRCPWQRVALTKLRYGANSH